MDFGELEPVIIPADSAGQNDQACQVFFWGDYHYCGDAGGGYIQCCPTVEVQP